MNEFAKIIKRHKWLTRRQAGMTYVELIVVLGIYAVMSSIIMFNHRAFQDRVDIKSLASDIGLQVVEAQKSSMSGKLPITGAPSTTWKPSYGVYFDTALPKQFIYFVDLDNDNTYDGGNELINLINITKDNYIDKIEPCQSISTCFTGPSKLAIRFKRPASEAFFADENGATVNIPQYARITVKSPQSAIAFIKIYKNGRIQID
jgi:type II secretory pathway pseudopilin PulG